MFRARRALSGAGLGESMPPSSANTGPSWFAPSWQPPGSASLDILDGQISEGARCTQGRSAGTVPG